MRESVRDILERLKFNPTEKQVELFDKLEKNKEAVKQLETHDYNFQFNANIRINELQNQVLNDLQNTLNKEDEIKTIKDNSISSPVGLLLSGFKTITEEKRITDGAES